ncbi:MAG: hypothetical protein INR73_25600 [Williamsia sp.]|nr:hypothetical protein [Williamsia sp.]
MWGFHFEIFPQIAQIVFADGADVFMVLCHLRILRAALSALISGKPFDEMKHFQIFKQHYSWETSPVAKVLNQIHS